MFSSDCHCKEYYGFRVVPHTQDSQDMLNSKYFMNIITTGDEFWVYDSETKPQLSFLDYIRYQQLNWYGHVQRIDEGRLLKKNWNGVHLEEEEKEDLEIRGYRK